MEERTNTLEMEKGNHHQITKKGNLKEMQKLERHYTTTNSQQNTRKNLDKQDKGRSR